VHRQSYYKEPDSGYKQNDFSSLHVLHQAKLVSAKTSPYDNLECDKEINYECVLRRPIAKEGDEGRQRATSLPVLYEEDEWADAEP